MIWPFTRKPTRAQIIAKAQADLARDVAARKASFETRQYVKHRAAALRHAPKVFAEGRA